MTSSYKSDLATMADPDQIKEKLDKNVLVLPPEIVNLALCTVMPEVALPS